MAFSNLVLPAVAPVQAGGQSLAAMQNVNAFTRGNLDNQILNAQSQYAPQQAQANAFLAQQQANYLPYQYKMQALPMMLMGAQGNPGLQQQIISQMTSPFQGGSNSGNQLMPLNSPPQNSLLSYLINKFTGNQPGNSNAINQNPSPQGYSQNTLNQVPNSQASQQNNMGNIPVVNGSQQNTNQNNGSTTNTTPSSQAGSSTNVNGSPIVPATQGPTAAVAGSLTANYNKNPFGNGTLIADPNNKGYVISTPNDEFINASQQSMIGDKNLRPIMQELNDGAQKWLAPNGEKGSIILGHLINGAQQYVGGLGGILPESMKEIGVTEKDLSDYDNWQADQSKGIEMIMKARNWPANIVSEEKIADILQPRPGEGRNYGGRIMHDLAQVDAQVQNYKDALQNGFTTAPLTIQYPTNDSSNSNNVPDNTKQSSVPQNQPANNGISQTSVKQSIQNTADQFKSKIIQFKGPDGNIWNVPQGKAQKFLDNNFKRVG